MTTPDAAVHDPQRIVGWVQQLLPIGDGLHHGVVELGPVEMRCACPVVVANAAPHCFHVGRDAKVEPRCPTCEAAAGRDRRAQAVYELEISKTYSRHG